GCNRYIISQCNSALNVIEVLSLLKLSGWQADDINIDIVPLFETVADLERASHIMKQLYENENYSCHLKRREKRQTIMLGFSADKKITLQEHEHELIQLLADESYKAYNELKNHPYFLDYLSYVSPLQFYADTNIGSRPAKRGSLSRLTLKDLRAIPFVGSWSQVKQNVTGYYGVGKALKKAQELGHFNEIKNLYHQSLY